MAFQAEYHTSTCSVCALWFHVSFPGRTAGARQDGPVEDNRSSKAIIAWGVGLSASVKYISGKAMIPMSDCEFMPVAPVAVVVKDPKRRERPN